MSTTASSASKKSTPVKQVSLLASSKFNKEVQAVLSIKAMEFLYSQNAMKGETQLKMYEKFYHGNPADPNKVSAIEVFLNPGDNTVYEHALDIFNVGGEEDTRVFALKSSTYNGQTGFKTLNLGTAFTTASLTGSTMKDDSPRITGRAIQFMAQNTLNTMKKCEAYAKEFLDSNGDFPSGTHEYDMV